MKLEFKYDKLTIKDMNKILYEDFTNFASTPRDKNPIEIEYLKRKKITQRNPQNKKGYQSYFKNIKPSKIESVIYEKNEKLKVKLKSNLFINKDTNTKDMLEQIEKLIK